MKRQFVAGMALAAFLWCGGALAATKIGAIGTTQLAGEWAAFKKPYSLGNKGSKMNITLKSAEYTMGQVLIGDQVYFPKENEKLLVLHYTIHNPEKKEQRASWSTFGFTAVDSENTNHDDINEVGQETGKKKLSMSLKPAQKVEAYTIIRVGAKGEVPKLMVARGNGLILRYDLRGKVKGLPIEYADPADPTGATALSEVPAKIGVYYQAQEFNIRVDSATTTTDKVGEEKPKKNGALAVVDVTFKNMSISERSLVWSTIDTELSTDIGFGKWLGSLYDKYSDRASSIKVKPGEEVTVKYIYYIKADSKLTSVSFINKGKIRYNFDLTASN